MPLEWRSPPLSPLSGFLLKEASMESPQEVVLLQGFKLENAHVLICNVAPPLQLIDTFLEVTTMNLGIYLRDLRFGLRLVKLLS